MEFFVPRGSVPVGIGNVVFFIRCICKVICVRCFVVARLFCTLLDNYATTYINKSSFLYSGVVRLDAVPTEKKFTLKNAFKNTIELLENSIDFPEHNDVLFYTGSVYVYFQGRNILGGASIAKKRNKFVGTKKDIDSLIPYATTVKAQFKMCNEWSFNTYARTASATDLITGRLCFDDVQDSYFISNGKLTKHHAQWYRSILQGKAANTGFILPNQLLSAIFNPLDNKLLALYATVYGR